MNLLNGFEFVTDTLLKTAYGQDDNVYSAIAKTSYDMRKYHPRRLKIPFVI